MHNSSDSDKPLLLVFPYDVMAHYLRCLQLVKYFEPWYSVRFLHSQRYHSFVSKAGYRTFSAAALDPDEVQHCVRSFNFSWLNETDLSKIYNEQVSVINQFNPAMVLGDMTPTLKMAAEKTGVFYISLLNGYMTRYYTHVRKMPRSYPLNKLFNYLPKSLYTYFTSIGEQMYFHDIHYSFNKIRKYAGLSRRDSYMDELEGDFNLVCDLPELFPQKQLPDNYQFVPPLFHPANNSIDVEIGKPYPSAKTLLVNMGSTGNWEKLNFLNEPEYRKYNIITAGDHGKVLGGSNVIAFDFIDNKEIFESTDLVICHGGNGTCYQALSHGIPVLALTTHFEQDYNMDGIERCGLGKVLNDLPVNYYPKIIDEFIERKNGSGFDWIQQSIAHASSSFDGKIIEQLANRCQLAAS
jgi:UDP:flavonoid glycosyltransferase YjiC (YdhE family)